MFQWHERVMLRWKLESGYWNDAQLFSFFETPGKRRLRVGIALVLILVGVVLFCWQMDDVAALELSCREPIEVEAVIDVVPYNSASYDKYVSYTYEGVQYERVFLYHTKSHLAMDDDGATITVTLDPRDHGALTQHMVNEEAVFGGMVLAALGLAGLLYSAFLGNEKLRSWLVRHGRPENRELDQPEYLVDVAVLTVLVYLVMTVGMWAVFPLAMGFGPTLGAGFALVMGTAFWGFGMALDRSYKGR